MNLRILKLSSLLFFISTLVSCSHHEKSKPNISPIVGDVFVQLSQLGEDQRLTENEQGWYVLQGENFDIKIIRHEFADKNESLKYIFNRRLLLHRNFQNEIAPYFGVIQLNQDCLKSVDTKGEMQENAVGDAWTKLSFPAKNDYSLYDCSSDLFKAVTTYYFHYCKAQNKVYETRFSKKLESTDSVKLSCQ